jgi:hypothetical protein
MKKLSLVILSISSMVYATPKAILQNNSTFIYHDIPQDVITISDMFTQGSFYGRLRFNYSAFKWDDEINKDGKWIRKDNAIGAIGGSLIYNSAYLYGLGFRVGGYASKAYGSLDDDLAYLYKGGKDLICRYDMLSDGISDMAVLAQAYIEYRYKSGYFQYGRVLFDSFLTKSNDTKMIPNGFEGYTYHSSDIPDTKIKVAYLLRQKLKDHTSYHHLLAWQPRTTTDKYAPYTQNDDSAMHRGLSLDKLYQRGIDDRLVVLEATNQTIHNLKITANYTAVPKLLSLAMMQLDYKISYGKWQIKPAIRYMYQFDDQAGKIGGANLKTITAGYKNPDSLDTYMIATRLDLVSDSYKLRFGYSYIADKADIVAPWRGFPTGGFTRAMSQYNWYANTKTYMARVDLNLDKMDIAKSTTATIKYAIQDFDDKKLGVPSDNDIITLDVIKRFETKPNLYLKFRFAHSFGKSITYGTIAKPENSYSEGRLELNYLF